jgi:putative addiction module antidote
MSAVKIRKIGNSLGILIPKEIQESLNISEGDLLDFVKITKGKAMLERHLPHHSQWKFEEDKTWLEAPLEDESDHVPKW